MVIGVAFGFGAISESRSPVRREMFARPSAWFRADPDCAGRFPVAMAPCERDENVSTDQGVHVPAYWAVRPMVEA